MRLWKRGDANFCCLGDGRLNVMVRAFTYAANAPSGRCDPVWSAFLRIPDTNTAAIAR
jgi:hypothetical protein